MRTPAPTTASALAAAPSTLSTCGHAGVCGCTCARPLACARVLVNLTQHTRSATISFAGSTRTRQLLILALLARLPSVKMLTKAHAHWNVLVQAPAQAHAPKHARTTLANYGGGKLSVLHFHFHFVATADFQQLDLTYGVSRLQ